MFHKKRLADFSRESADVEFNTLIFNFNAHPISW
jgi:hypothetical protein